MALKKLSKIRNLKDPLKQFQITFTISKFPGLNIGLLAQKNALQSENRHVIDDMEELEMRCTSFSYPGTKLGQSNVTIAGFRRKLATIQNKSGVWTCQFTEDQNGGVLNTIQAWCDIIHNQLTGIRLPSTYYVTTCLVKIETAENKLENYGEHGRTLWLKGFYPIRYSVDTIGASESAPVSVTVDFNYDWWTEFGTSGSALGV